MLATSGVVPGAAPHAAPGITQQRPGSRPEERGIFDEPERAPGSRDSTGANPVLLVLTPARTEEASLARSVRVLRAPLAGLGLSLELQFVKCRRLWGGNASYGSAP